MSPGDLTAFETATRDLVGLALRSVERSDLSLPQFRLLQVLVEIGPSSATRCAAELGVVGSTVTRLADRLSASGHLERREDPTNRSMVELAVTDTGRRVVLRVADHRRQELSAALAHLDPAQRAACTAALGTLHEVLGAGGPVRHLPL